MTNYTTYKYGQITKMEAGTIYRAMKEGKIEVLPETTKTLYDMVKENIRYADERYSRDHIQYDRIYKAVEAILSGDYATAQENLKAWEEEQIRLAGKKSIFRKYQ